MNYGHFTETMSTTRKNQSEIKWTLSYKKLCKTKIVAKLAEKSIAFAENRIHWRLPKIFGKEDKRFENSSKKYSATNALLLSRQQFSRINHKERLHYEHFATGGKTFSKVHPHPEWKANFPPGKQNMQISITNGGKRAFQLAQSQLGGLGKQFTVTEFKGARAPWGYCTTASSFRR